MLSVGTLLRNRYRIDRMLEISATGGLYRAWDTQGNLPVVVRELLPQPDLNAQAMAVLQRHFEAEAAALLPLAHPHLAQALDYFCERPEMADYSVGNRPEQPSAYVITEYIEGERLLDRVRQEGPSAEDRALSWAVQLLGALDYVHRSGLLHKDIRPENIIIRTDGKAALTNFGLTGLWQPSDPRKWAATQVLGTPEYASPEQWQQQVSQIDPRSDIYGFGATLYFALSGTPPPAAAERTANPYRFLPLKGLSPRISGHVQKAILRAMALPRDKRYPDARTMLGALHAPAASATIEARPAPLILEPRRAVVPMGWILGLVFSVLVICAVGLAVTIVRTPISNVAPTSGVPTPAPTRIIALDPATPTGAAPAAATRTPRPTATLEPRLDLGLTRALTWTTVLDDAFDINAHAWLTSTGQDDWGSIARTITEGQYVWRVGALQSVGRWCTPDMPALDNFYVSVDARRESGPLNTAYGLILRHSEGSYHVFSVRDDGYFRFSSWYGFEWQTEVDWTATLELKPGEVNQLAVIGEGARFELYANGALLDVATSELLSVGEVGLSVEAAEPGDAVVVFDNFRVRAPQNAAQPEG